VRGNADNTGELMRAKLDGSSQTVMASGLASPALLAQTATALFWSNQGSAAASFADGSVQWMGKDGTCPGVSPCPFAAFTIANLRTTNPALAKPFGVAPSADGTHVAAAVLPDNIVWVQSNSLGAGGYGTPSLPVAVALGADGGVYVTTSSTVSRVNVLANGALTTLAADAAAPMGIALDDAGAFAYVAMNGDGVLAAVALDGGGVSNVATRLDHPAFIALDGDYVYFTAQGTSGMSNGYVGKVGKDGTCPSAWGAACPVILANGQGLPGSLAVDAKYVYWVDTEGGTVLKVAK
jgi:DNA-binding beta-propeller fold protein YncE